MGEISRQHTAGIVAGAPNDAAQVSAELDNIINAGVNDNWDRGGLATPNGGSISINDNANNIDQNTTDITALDGRVTINESDIADNVTAIGLNTANRLVSQVLVDTTQSGTVSPTLTQVKDYNSLYLKGYPLTGMQYVSMPVPTVNELGRRFSIYGLGAGGISGRRVLTSSNIVDFDGAARTNAIEIARDQVSNEIQLVCVQTPSSAYRWMYLGEATLPAGATGVRRVLEIDTNGSGGTTISLEDAYNYDVIVFQNQTALATNHAITLPAVTVADVGLSLEVRAGASRSALYDRSFSGNMLDPDEMTGPIGTMKIASDSVGSTCFLTVMEGRTVGTWYWHVSLHTYDTVV